MGQDEGLSRSVKHGVLPLAGVGAGASAALVTETFDCSRSPEDLRKAVRDGEGWRDAMTASLARLGLLAKAAGQRNQ